MLPGLAESVPGPMVINGDVTYHVSCNVIQSCSSLTGGTAAARYDQIKYVKQLSFVLA